MPKTILLTGATDGIGLAAARSLVGRGHKLLIHGRSATRLAATEQALAALCEGAGSVQSYRADLGDLAEVEALAAALAAEHDRLDVLINNAGVLKTATPISADGFDLRFVVNTFAPYLLSRRLLPLLAADGRIINLSSAAQSPVDPKVLLGEIHLAEDIDVYAQSKLAITMWSRDLAQSLGDAGPAVVAVNPGSLLATKMVREGFGIDGKDVGIGAEIIVRAALSDEFAAASGRYFDNDAGQFADPHADALNDEQCARLTELIETALRRLGADPAA